MSDWIYTVGKFYFVSLLLSPWCHDTVVNSDIMSVIVTYRRYHTAYRSFPGWYFDGVSKVDSQINLLQVKMVAVDIEMNPGQNKPRRRLIHKGWDQTSQVLIRSYKLLQRRALGCFLSHGASMRNVQYEHFKWGKTRNITYFNGTHVNYNNKNRLNHPSCINNITFIVNNEEPNNNHY